MRRRRAYSSPYSPRLSLGLPAACLDRGGDRVRRAASVYGLTKLHARRAHRPRPARDELARRGRRQVRLRRRPLLPLGRTRGPPGGIAIVDASRPRATRGAGTIPAGPAPTQRELRADAGLGLLVVEELLAVIDGGERRRGTPINYLKVYDIRRTACTPKLLSTYDFGARAPHEFFCWKDAEAPRSVARLRHVHDLLARPDGARPRPTRPPEARRRLRPRQRPGAEDGGLRRRDAARVYIHSHLGQRRRHPRLHRRLGLRHLVARHVDARRPAGGRPVVTRPVGHRQLDYGAQRAQRRRRSPGGNVRRVGAGGLRDAGHGCPFGWLRTADLTDPDAPKLVGQFKLPENDPRTCGQKNGTFSSHNQTLFPT